MTQELAWLGTLLSGVSLLIASIVAAITLFFFNNRTIRQEWVDGYHRIYAEFWKDSDIALVRKWITSDDDYKALASVINRRLQSAENTLTSDENDMLEKIDRFCALLARMRSFGEMKVPPREVNLWRQLYGDFWIAKVRSRRELMNYINIYWENLLPSQARLTATS